MKSQYRRTIVALFFLNLIVFFLAGLYVSLKTGLPGTVRNQWLMSLTQGRLACQGWFRELHKCPHNSPVVISQRLCKQSVSLLIYSNRQKEFLYLLQFWTRYSSHWALEDFFSFPLYEILSFFMFFLDWISLVLPWIWSEIWKTSTFILVWIVLEVQYSKST